MARGKKKEALTPEERLQAALVPESEQPYPVPENWCWTYLGCVSDVVTGGTPSKKHPEYYGGLFPFFKPTDLDFGRHVVEASEYLTDEGKMVSRIIPEQSTAVCCIGSIGKCGFLEVEGTTNQQINSAIPKFNPLFLYYYCNTHYFNEELWSKASATTISIVNKSKMESCVFPLPPLPEQLRIVDRIESLFAKLDEAKQKTQDALDSFETRKAAILHKAFTGELTTQWRKEHGLGMESWNETILKDVCKVNPKKIDVNGLPDDLEVTFFPMASLSETYGEITKPQTRLLKDVKNGFTNFSEGDVVFAKITPCMENGKSAIIGKLVNGIGYGTTEFYVLRCNEKLYNRYLYHMVRDTSFRNKAKAVMSGAVGQQRVPKSFMENYPLNLPSVPEQAEIVRILDDLLAKEQQAKDAAEAVLEQIDLIKKSILARAFRGELGTNDPAEESSIELLKQNFWETIKSEKVKPKQVTNKKAKVIFVRKTIMETLSRGMSLTPENLKSETGLPIDDFYAQLKELVNNGSVVERRENGESYLEVANENR